MKGRHVRIAAPLMLIILISAFIICCERPSGIKSDPKIIESALIPGVYDMPLSKAIKSIDRKKLSAYIKRIGDLRGARKIKREVKKIFEKDTFS